MISRAFLVSIVILLAIAADVHGAGEMRLCGSEKQATWQQKVCTMKTEAYPCLKESAPAWNDVCCKRKCSLQDIAATFCCFSEECLEKCYPGKGYKMGSVY